MKPICELNGKPCIHYPDKDCTVYCEVYISTPISKRIEVQKRIYAGKRKYGKENEYDGE